MVSVIVLTLLFTLSRTQQQTAQKTVIWPNLLCRKKPLVKTRRPNRTDYNWLSLGYYKELGEAH